MSTFKQQIEEIVKPNGCDVILCKEYESSGFKGLYNCTKCQADRICAALKELVEGMPRLLLKAEGLKANYKIDAVLYNSGADEQFEACKSYMLEGMDGH